MVNILESGPESDYRDTRLQIEGGLLDKVDNWVNRHTFGPMADLMYVHKKVDFATVFGASTVAGLCVVAVCSGGDLEQIKATAEGATPGVVLGAVGAGRHLIGGERVNSWLRDRLGGALFAEAHFYDRWANRAEARGQTKLAKHLRDHADTRREPFLPKPG